ncbi:hypothetical protein BDR22DRAFT_824697 [Usnea florida]
MHAPHSPSPSSKPSQLAKATILIATFLPSTYAANQWLYPDVHTIPTYNFLDTVNASWTSNFVAPYLLLLCHPPDDTAHYAYPYNHSIPATGSSLVPLDDGQAWTCHFQVSDLHDSSANPPTFNSNDFNIVLNYGQKPIVWSDTNSSGESPASGAIANPTTGSPSSSIRSSEPTLSPTTTISTSLTSTSTSSPPPPTTAPIPASTSTSKSSSTPSSAPTPSQGLSKSQKVAVIVGTIMGALFLLILTIAILFVRRLRSIERNTSVVYRRSGADRNGDRFGGGGGKGGEYPGLEAPRERWKGVELQHDHQMQGFF